MMTFLLSIVAIGVAAFILNALLDLLGRSWRSIFIVVTFVVVGIGAYAVSFVTDMILQAFLGQLPSASIVWPCITWLLIALCSLAICARRPVPFLALVAPFWLFGGMALVASFAHSWNLITAISLILGGVAYGHSPGKYGSATRRDSVGRGSVLNRQAANLAAAEAALTGKSMDEIAKAGQQGPSGTL
jgi:hypothetical protein